MDDLAQAWDARIEALLGRLPQRVGSAVAWLREPSRHLVRFGAGILFVLGGIFSILPVLGIWMLPLGLALIAEDVPGLKPHLERAARLTLRVWRALRGWRAGGSSRPGHASRMPPRLRPPGGA